MSSSRVPLAIRAYYWVLCRYSRNRGKSGANARNYRVKMPLSQDFRFAAVAKCVRIRFTRRRLSPGSSHAFKELAP
jgi:hypothetical protein